MAGAGSSPGFADAVRALLPAALADRLAGVRLAGDAATVVLSAETLSPREQADAEAQVRAALSQVPEIAELRVAFTSERTRPRVMAIASGKGGVGKSTLTANLAVALARAGVRVGVVDADVYGPSQPTMLATEGQQPESAGERLVPLTSPHGVTMLSMGNIVAADKALAWRGAMAVKALTQLMQADWGDAQLLLIDLPPGTGDIQLTMIRNFRPDAALVVSTPQDLALIDARRAMDLFAQVDVPVLGLVENMAGYACPHCGEVSDPFGTGGAQEEAARRDLPFLGRVPLAIGIRSGGDEGRPAALGEAGDAGEAFAAIARIVREWLEPGA